MNFLVNASKNSTISAASLTFNGVVKVTLVADRELKAGDELKLWTVSGTFSGTPTFDLPAGYIWDTSRINEGVIVVTGATGISQIENGKLTMENSVYDLNGRLVRRMSTASDIKGLPAGIYIRGGKKVVVK